MIRLPTEGIGLRFEREPETGQSLDVALLEAATVNAEPLPLLEHVLWELWRRQRTRKDGLLRWSDYRESGELKNSLAEHAERVLLALGADAQGALKPVIRQLVSIGHGEEARWIRRTVPKCDLVATSEFNPRQRAGAKALIDRFIDERLFQGETDPEGETLVRIAQESLLRNWPRVCHLLDEDLGFLRMRDRLEAKLKLWVSKGRRNRDLLRSAASLSEAETLVQGFRDSLSDMQVEYLQRSLKVRSRRHRLRRSAVLGGLGGLAVLVGALGQRAAVQTRLKGIEAEVQEAQKNTQLATSQRDGLQAQLKQTEAKAQQDAALAASQRDSLQAQLNESQAKAQQAQKDTELAASQRDSLQAQLKETAARVQQAQQNAELTASQRDALQAQLNETEAKVQQVQQNAELAASQRDALQTRVKETEAGSQQLQKDLEVATSQREGLQGQLKDSEAKLEQAQNNGELVASERDRLQAQAADLSAAAQQAQNNKGLGSPEATAVNGFNADSKSTDPASKNEPMTQDQEPAKFARMTQSQATASPPIPSVAASVAPTPEAQADSSTKTSAEERSLEQFVQEYIQTVASDDISAQEHFFAQRVNFYGQGVLSLPGVQASMERYHREWPIRKWEPSGEPKFPKTLHSTNPHLYEVLQPLTWTVSNGLQHKEGKATLYVRIWKNDKGEFHIVQVEQRNP